MMPEKMQDHLLHPSGGLVWHLRALQNLRYWRPLRNTVQLWLHQWMHGLPAHCQSLVLVGPSAGWTLPWNTLQHFSHIAVFEPDIVARQILRVRCRSRDLRFDDTNVFSPGGLEYLCTHYPDHAILFCNVLGQLSPDDEEQSAPWCQHLTHTLADQHWASYHDLFSTRQAPLRALSASEFSAGTSVETIARIFWRDSEIEICDHGTQYFGLSHSFACIPWRLRKSQWHLVQWVSHNANAIAKD